MGADQEARRPGADGVAGGGGDCTGQHDAHEARGLHQQAEGLQPAFLRLGRAGNRRGGARRVHRGPQQQAEEDARRADHHEGGAPAVVLGHPATKTQAEDRAQAGAKHQHRHGGGAALRRIEFGDHRHRGGGATGLADGHADACQQEEHEAAGQATEHGHHAPGDAGDGDDRLAA
ncbi:hypothetical protein D3C78_1193150 [compost metagenome]